MHSVFSKLKGILIEKCYDLLILRKIFLLLNTGLLKNNELQLSLDELQIYMLW